MCRTIARVKQHLIEKRVIDRYNNVKDIRNASKEIRAISEELGGKYGVREDLAYFVNNKQKIEYKVEISGFIDAKNGLFYRANNHLKNKSPFATSAFGTSARGESFNYEFLKRMGEHGKYTVYNGNVYLYMNATSEGDALLYSPSFEKKFIEAPQDEITVFDKRAVRILVDGKPYYLTPSNKVLDMEKHLLLDSDNIISRVRQTILEYEELVDNDQVLYNIYEEYALGRADSMTFNEFKVYAKGLLYNFKGQTTVNGEEITNNNLRDKMMCL